MGRRFRYRQSFNIWEGFPCIGAPHLWEVLPHTGSLSTCWKTSHVWEDFPYMRRLPILVKVFHRNGRTPYILEVFSYTGRLPIYVKSSRILDHFPYRDRLRHAMHRVRHILSQRHAMPRLKAMSSHSAMPCLVHTQPHQRHAMPRLNTTSL